MTSASARRLVALSVSIVGALSVSSTAIAATPFGCRASISAARPASAAPVVEPYVANRPEVPCATDTAGASSGSAGGVGTAGPAAAYTYSSASANQTAGPVAPGATALVSLNGGSIANSGSSIVVAGPAQAQAAYGCVNGTAVPSASSSLSVATVNGQAVSLSSPGAEQTVQLGGGSYVTFNQKSQDSTSLTQRLVFMHVAGVGDFVLGEAQVTLGTGDPCAGTSGGGGGGGTPAPPTLNACPPGSTLIPSAQMCEIIVPGGRNIGVTRPFAGETGGTVVSLAKARKKYKSGCLYGPGPKYAIVGTKRADRIEGTWRGDRILGLGGNDRIAGHGGNDCLDGGPGTDRIFGGNGKDRVYGGPGNDRLSVQNGSSRVWGGAGNDWIFLGNGTDQVWGGAGSDRISVGRGNDRVWGGAGNDAISTGNGNDWVWGGAGNDYIYVGTGKDHLFGGGGNDRMFGPGLVVYATCGSGRSVVYVNVFGMPYARAHGCRTVRKIHTHTL